jgi:aryl-alcohol dehydrogenase-like predicted oxidoreductase
VIYNLFEQEPVAELLPVAEATGTAVIVRVAFDEGALTGKFSAATTFEKGDFRQRYFAGDRLERTVKRVEAIREDAEEMGFEMPELALKFAMSHPAVSTVIPGMRNRIQAEKNTAVSDLRDLSGAELEKLRCHRWLRAFWYFGK